MTQSRATDESTHDTMLALTDRLAAAESRAAVAEYRAEHALDLFERTDAKLSDALRRLGEAEHRARVAEGEGKLTALESAAIILALVVAFVLGGVLL